MNHPAELIKEDTRKRSVSSHPPPASPAQQFWRGHNTHMRAWQHAMRCLKLQQKHDNLFWKPTLYPMVIQHAYM